MKNFFNSKKMNNREKNNNLNQTKTLEPKETTFPLAEDVLKETAENWNHLTKEMILKKINEKKEYGSRFVWFDHSIISDELKSELERSHFKVKVFEYISVPTVEISW